MGANVFMVRASGKTAREAFSVAVKDAQYESGHGYTGTIAEKDEYVMIDCPKGVDPRTYADQLVEDGDRRIDDKWGPAGCIALGDGKFLFFGWASS